MDGRPRPSFPACAVSAAGGRHLERLDIVIDSGDQINLVGCLVNGGGAACRHPRKLVAVTADRLVVKADSTKLVAGGPAMEPSLEGDRTSSERFDGSSAPAGTSPER